MFEKPTTKLEKAQTSEKTTEDHYAEVLEDAYEHGGSLDFPELEVFGVDQVDMEAISEFSLSLVDFIEKREQEADEEELERLHHFGRRIHSDFFSASPNLINYIRLPDRLKLMTRATRSKVVQETFGSVFVGETVYDISFMEGRLDEVTIKVMGRLSVPEQLDLLHQLRTVGARAIVNGEWSRPAVNQVLQTYETLRNSENSAIFIQLAAEAGLETLDTEYENPQLSFIRFEGQTSDSRLNTRFSNEQVVAITDKFFSKYSLDHVISNSTKVVPATKDALVCLDRSGLASGIVRINVPEFLSSPESELDFDVNQYRIYMRHLDNAEQIPIRKKHEVVVKIYHAIYNEYVGELIANGDAGQAAKVFAQILPILSEGDWKKYFTGEIKQREYPSQNELYKEAGDENGRVSHEFVTGLFKYRDQLGERYEEDYLELETALEHEDFEHAFEIASKIALKARYESIDIDEEEARMRKQLEKIAAMMQFKPERLSREQLELEKEIKKMRTYITQLQHEIGEEGVILRRKVRELSNQLQELHRANIEVAQKKFEASMTELGQTEEIQARAEIVRKIEDNLDELSYQLRSFIEGKLTEAKDLPQLKLTNLKELMLELRGEESLRKVTDEDVLLFQHVHSSELGYKINNKFGFALSDFSLKEQYYFLNYLKNVTPHSVERMQRFTTVYGTNGMRTFLALERSGEITGDDIVRFGTEFEDAGKVFESFGKLLDAQEELENFIRNDIKCEAEQCEKILKTAQDRLRNETYEYLIKAIKNPETLVNLQQVDTSIARARSLSAAFTSYFASGGRSVEALNSFESTQLPGPEVLKNQTLVDQMISVYRNNYKQLGYQNTAIDDLVHNFEENIAHPNSRVWTWQIGNQEILSFALTFEEPDLKHVHVSGLNINPDLKTSRAGKDLLEQLTRHYKEQGWELTAEASPDNFRGYSEADWVATTIVEDDLEAEAHLFNIAIFPGETFASKSLSRREIVELASGVKTINGVTVFEADNEHVVPKLHADEVITRFLRIPARNNSPERYLYVLEKRVTHTPTAPQRESGA